MSIPDEWRYETHLINKWPFITKLPVAWVLEGTSTIQCLCPYCDYGKGYNEPFLTINATKKVLTCPTCNNQFIGIT